MTFSLWHLLGLIPVAVGIASVTLTPNRGTIGRWAFFVRLFGLFTFGVALAYIMKRREEGIAAAVMLLYLMAACYLIPYWATSRLRDMGVHHKYWAVLTDVPVVGWLYTLYLLCVKGVGEPPNKEEEDEDDLPPLVPQEMLQKAIEARARSQELKRIA